MKFASKQDLVDRIDGSRAKIRALLDQIPATAMDEPVVDGLSVKDLLAHRTEWGRMALRWVAEAQAGETPEVPAPGYTWKDLNALNAEIHDRFRDAPLGDVLLAFESVHAELRALVVSLDEVLLLEKNRLSFTGSKTLASYLNSATAAHDLSAAKHIGRWWRDRAAT